MTAKSRIALTFDDGPGPSTAELLRVLARHRVRATFFMLGKNLQGAALAGDGQQAMRVAVDAIQRGHVVGNHTMTHRPSLDRHELRDEIAACDRLIRACHLAAGIPAPVDIPIRLPFGPFRTDGLRSVRLLARMGRPHCHWSGDPQDWRPGRTAAQIVSAVLNHADKAWAQKKLPTILLHDAGQGGGPDDPFGVVRPATVEAVDQMCTAFALGKVEYVAVEAGLSTDRYECEEYRDGTTSAVAVAWP